MLRPKIGLDWDDVLAPFNDIAIEMANKKYNIDPPLTLEDVTSWNNTGKAAVIKEFYFEDELYHSQVVSEKTKRCVRQLMKIADVYIITAAYPKYMGIRAKQILEEFPEIPESRIILGSAKSLVHLDIILDDAIHNVMESPAQQRTFPARMLLVIAVGATLVAVRILSTDKTLASDLALTTILTTSFGIVTFSDFKLTIELS